MLDGCLDTAKAREPERLAPRSFGTTLNTAGSDGLSLEHAVLAEGDAIDTWIQDGDVRSWQVFRDRLMQLKEYSKQIPFLSQNGSSVNTCLCRLGLDPAQAC